MGWIGFRSWIMMAMDCSGNNRPGLMLTSGSSYLSTHPSAVRDRPSKGDRPRPEPLSLSPWSAPSPHAPAARARRAAPPEEPCEGPGMQGPAFYDNTARWRPPGSHTAEHAELAKFCDSVYGIHQQGRRSIRVWRQGHAHPVMVMRWPMAHAGPCVRAHGWASGPFLPSHQQHSPSQHTVQLTCRAGCIPCSPARPTPSGQSLGRAWQEVATRSERRTGGAPVKRGLAPGG